MNPGGPGASGVRRVARGFQITPEVGDRFDIVGFDPRGVGESTPITCGDAVPAFRAADLAPDTPEEEAAARGGGAGGGRRVRGHRGRPARPLGSVEVAHDIEVIRRALGEERISFVGLSYGTLLGQLWAEWYPTSVRALVLDGVVSPAARERRRRLRRRRPRACERVLRRDGAALRRRPGVPAGRRRAGWRRPTTSWPGGSRTGRSRGGGVGPDPARLRGVLGDLRRGDLAARCGRRWPTASTATWRASPTWPARSRGSWPTRRSPSCRASTARTRRATTTGRRAPTRYVERVAALRRRSSPTSCSRARSGPRARSSRTPSTPPGAPPILVVGSTGDAATPYETAVAVGRAARLGRAAHRRARRARRDRRLRLRRRRHHALPRRPRAARPPAPAADPTWRSAAAAPLLSAARPTEPMGGSPANGVQPRRPARRRLRRDRRPRVHRVARPAPHLRRGRRAHEPARQPPHRRGPRRARRARRPRTGTRPARTTSRATSTTATSTSRRCSAPTRPGWRRST